VSPKLNWDPTEFFEKSGSTLFSRGQSCPVVGAQFSENSKFAVTQWLENMDMASHKLPSLIGTLGLRNDAANDITMRYQDAVFAIDRDCRYKAPSFCIVRADQNPARFSQF
jgi:hypothetical protein